MTPQNTKTCNYCGHNFWALDKCPKCRDRFAAAALTGLLSSDATDGESYEEFAEESYRLADAMIEARDE